MGVRITGLLQLTQQIAYLGFGADRPYLYPVQHTPIAIQIA